MNIMNQRLRITEDTSNLMQAITAPMALAYALKQPYESKREYIRRIRKENREYKYHPIEVLVLQSINNMRLKKKYLKLLKRKRV